MGEAIAKTIDPVFRKRGFASRDLIAQWGVVAPKPYDKVSIPDQLKWPRGEAGAEGAILFLRCAPSHRLALAHEGALIAGAINRYFGYLLVGSVKISKEPFSPRSDDDNDNDRQPTKDVQRAVGATISDVEDDDLKEALRRLGHGLMKQKT